MTTRICILGGGFGGLYTALRLNQLAWEPFDRPEIILVDQNDRFLFLPLLYELVTGELEIWEVAPPFMELLASTQVQFLQGTVLKIDTTEKQAHLQDGSSLPYDHLVLALGGETPLDWVSGAADHALSFRSLNDAYLLEERLKILESKETDKIRVAVIGGGYSGVELACKLGDRLGDRGRLRILEQGSQILNASSDFNRNTAQRSLDSRGIWVDLETRVKAISTDSLTLEYKGQTDVIPTDLVLWTAGTQVVSPIKELPFEKNQRGQLITSSTLQLASHPEIFAIGDLAATQDGSGQTLPATAQVAYQQADYVAWNLWAGITGRPPLPFHYFPLGEMLSLGLDSATLSGLGLKLEGTPAYVLRRLAYLYRMPTLDHQLKVGFNWITKPLRELIQG
ncbi:MAG: NAD(P)/FAD-dependent oxidoreductase [Synechococcales bacterium]|nr:NAD(P)/FAD-dependent oxidoreductase [Cyanobacteria bacterium REEB444]MEB3126303.1 NAD(P)/FAD-dependent oxidoreductase [Synechococcales bacterium]